MGLGKGTFALVVIVIVIILIAAGTYILGSREGVTTGSDSSHEGSITSASTNLTVAFIDVGQGDAILIQTPDSKNVLIDAGPGASVDRLVTELKQFNVTTIDALIVTHPHEDHLGGAEEVLAHFVVLSVYHPGYLMTTAAYSNFIEAADAEGCPIYTDAGTDPGDFLAIGSNVTFQVLAIDADAEDANSASIVIRMTYGAEDFLFMGDAPSEVEENLVSSYGSNLDSEVLKIGHHGSRYSSSASFLTDVDPEISVICVGENDYGHPHEETLERLASCTSGTVVTTESYGTIMIETDGTELTFYEDYASGNLQ